jgi:hypothetical protein
MTLDINSFKIRYGSANRESGGVVAKIKEIHLHEQFNATLNENCIALIELKEMIIPQHYKNDYTINTVCLPEKDILNDKPEEVEFSGWGKTANIKGHYPQTLKSTKYEILTKCYDNQYNYICVNDSSVTHWACEVTHSMNIFQ